VSKAIVVQKLFILSYNYTRKRDYVIKGGYTPKVIFIVGASIPARIIILTR